MNLKLDMQTPNTIITDDDRRRLGTLVATGAMGQCADERWLDELEFLLEDAHPVETEHVPDNVVTMNSRVRLVDTETGEDRIVRLAYPEDLDFLPDGLSVLAPLGTALIGCQAGDIVVCRDDQCRRRWRVAEILYQPEQAGDWLL